MEAYFSTSGTINRISYFRHTIVIFSVILIVMFLTILYAVPNKISPYSLEGLLLAVPQAIIFHYSWISLNIRRLRHIGRSGWWSVLTLIPFITWVFYVFLLIVKGKE